MRQFGQAYPNPDQFRRDEILSELRGFQQVGSAIAKALELPCSLRPEVSLLLELFEAEKKGKRLTVSMLGLLDGIAPTTALRYVELLEKRGALMRLPHETDHRMRYVKLMPEAKKTLEEAIAAVHATILTPLKPDS